MANSKYILDKYWSHAFDYLEDPIFIIDMENRIIRINESMKKFVGKEHKDIEGKSCYEAVHALSIHFSGCPFSKAMETKKFSRAEIYEPYLKRWLDIRVMPIFDEENSMIGAIHMATDVTGRRALIEDLKKTKEDMQVQQEDLIKINGEIKTLYNDLAYKNSKLQELDAMRNESINYITHELRTPLVPIKEGISQVLDGLYGQLPQ